MANATPARLTPVEPKDLPKVDPVANAEAEALAPKVDAPATPEAAPVVAPAVPGMDPAAIAMIVAAVMAAMGPQGKPKPAHNTTIPVDTAEYRRPDGAHVGTHDAVRKDN